MNETPEQAARRLSGHILNSEMAGVAIKARISAMAESSLDEHEPPEGYFRITSPAAYPGGGDAPSSDLTSCDGCHSIFKPKFPSHRFCVRCWSWIQARPLLERANKLLQGSKI